jgi:hypothetical protein
MGLCLLSADMGSRGCGMGEAECETRDVLEGLGGSSLSIASSVTG